MAKYFNKADRIWSPAHVRGLDLEKLPLWDEGFDIESNLFRMTEGMTIDRHTHHHWVQVVVVEGSPVPQILRHAEQLPADLLVMGTHGRSGFEALFLGSITEKVLRSTRVPVPSARLT